MKKREVIRMTDGRVGGEKEWRFGRAREAEIQSRSRQSWGILPWVGAGAEAVGAFYSKALSEPKHTKALSLVF